MSSKMFYYFFSIFSFIDFFSSFLRIIKKYISDFVSTSTQSYFVSEEAVNWTNAKRACVEAGYELASVLTLREKERLDNFLEDNRLTPKDAYCKYYRYYLTVSPAK